MSEKSDEISKSAARYALRMSETKKDEKELRVQALVPLSGCEPTTFEMSVSKTAASYAFKASQTKETDQASSPDDDQEEAASSNPSYPNPGDDDDDDDDIQYEIAPLPSLQRASRQQAQVSLPGAFAVGGAAAQVRSTISCYNESANHHHQRGDSSAAGDIESDTNDIDSDTAPLDDSAEDDNDALVDSHHIDSAHLVEEDAEGGDFPALFDQERGGEPPELIEGTILHPKNQGEQQQTCHPALTAFVLVGCVAIVVTFLVVFLQPNNGVGGVPDDEMGPITTPINTVAPTAPLTISPPFTDDISSPIIAEGINDTTSPWYHANKWLVGDPNLDAYPLYRQWQRFYLAGYYFALKGDEWYRNDNWLSYDHSECEWWSSSFLGGETAWSPEICDDESKLLVFNMSGNNLQGEQPLAPFIPYVVAWDLSYNKFVGKIPMAADLGDLLYYNVAEAGFEGPIVGQFGSFKIQYIHTNGNDLAGLTSGLWKYIPDLKELVNHGNSYAGTISAEYRHLKNLTVWHSAQNLYSGALPSELGEMTSLEYWNMSYNVGLNGTLPSELGMWTNLYMMDISGTQITGSLPEPLCQWHREGRLEIHANCSLVECCSD